LSGSVIPGALVLRRICSFLGIHEHHLFEEVQVKDTGTLRAPARRRRIDIPIPAAVSSKLDFHVSEMKPGHYFSYFPLQNVPDMLLRSLLIIRDGPHAKTFKRLSKFRMPIGSQQPVRIGHHVGQVLASQNEIYMIGLNKRQPHQVSYMTINRPVSSDEKTPMIGLTVTRNAAQVIAVPTCVVRADQTVNIRHLLPQIGVIHTTETPDVALALGSLR
jgi:hypothetical protein